MDTKTAVLKGIIPAHTREEKDWLIEDLRAKLRIAKEALGICKYYIMAYAPKCARQDECIKHIQSALKEIENG